MSKKQSFQESSTERNSGLRYGDLVTHSSELHHSLVNRPKLKGAFAQSTAATLLVSKSVQTAHLSIPA